MSKRVDHEQAARAAVAAGPRKRRAWSTDNAGNRAIREELTRAALRAGGLAGGGPVLDAGCGTGWWLARLAEAGVDTSRLHGTELLPERAAAAQAACPGADVRIGDITDLPYDDAVFEAVYLLTVLSSLPGRAEVRQAVGECWRVLAPGGRLIVWEPRIPSPLNARTGLVRRGDLARVTGVRPGGSSLTLAPPLARRLGRHTARWYPRLARVPLLRTHALHVCIAPLASPAA
jgi:SAM-dependent methyltransferase